MAQADSDGWLLRLIRKCRFAFWKMLAVFASSVSLAYFAVYANATSATRSPRDVVSAMLNGMVKVDPRPPPRQHCILVVSRLYGNHTPLRVNASLNWYKKVTLESIRIAAKFSGEHFANIEAALSAEGSYATEAKKLGEEGNALDVHVDDNEGLSRLFPSILQRKSCDLVSLVRIDADDMLSPFAFENIRWAWEQRRCKSAAACAQVVGTKKKTSLVLAPLTDRGKLKCLIGSDYNSFFASAGLSVTLPVGIYLEHFEEKIVVHSHHVKLFNKIEEKMTGLRMQADSYEMLDHAFLAMTPLSGHFNHANPRESEFGRLRTCELSYLISELGTDLGNLIWNARKDVPELTVDEWKQNIFVKLIWNSKNRQI